MSSYDAYLITKAIYFVAIVIALTGVLIAGILHGSRGS